MLFCQFLCHVLKAILFITIALKLSYFCKKIQKFRASPSDPHWPPGGWGQSPQTPKQAPHCEFLASRLLFIHQVSNARRQRSGLLVFRSSCHLYPTLGGGYKLSFLILNIKQKSCEYQFLESLTGNRSQVNHLAEALSIDH